jgi:hypothetical protein
LKAQLQQNTTRRTPAHGLPSNYEPKGSSTLDSRAIVTSLRAPGCVPPLPDKIQYRNRKLIGRLSELLKNVRCCRARIQGDQKIFNEYENWKAIRLNVEACRREIQSVQSVLDPDPSLPSYREFIIRLNEITHVYALANYEVELAFVAAGKANLCLGLIRMEGQLLSQSLLLKRRWAKMLAQLSCGPDLEGLEQRLAEMLDELTLWPATRRRGGQVDDSASAIKEQVQQCWIRHRRPNFRQLCMHLDHDKIGRPPYVQWAGYTWQSAHAANRSRVDKWLSSCLKPVRATLFCLVA